jgi:uncharacterized protein (DUF58 family)
MRLRKRAAGLIFGAVVLFFLGTNVQAGWLLVLSAALIGAVVAGAVLPFVMMRKLEFGRRAPQELHQNDEVLVDLEVTNASRGMRLGISVSDPLLSPATMFIPVLAPGATAEVTTSRRAQRRGLFHGAEVVVATDAPFGVAQRKKRVNVEGETLVLPAIVDLPELDFIEPAPANASAMRSAPRRGHGPEYFGIREYRTGDSMRHVHWPSTARTGHVMVREFEQETTRRLAIVVDASYDAGSAWTPLDRCCSAAASIALAASSRGHGARLALGGDGEVEVLSRADPGELLLRLALLGPDPRLEFHRMIAGLADGLVGAETVVLVFPSWRINEAQTMAPAVGDLAQRFTKVLALVVEVDADEAPGAAASTAGKQLLAAGLANAGAEVRFWPRSMQLDQVLSADRAEVPA